MAWTEKGIIDRFQEMAKNAKAEGIQVKGQKEFVAFCEGESISARQAILAHCYECLGYFGGMEGSRDCENPVCPLYPFMPYSTRKRVVRTVSLENREKARSRFKENNPHVKRGTVKEP